MRKQMGERCYRETKFIQNSFLALGSPLIDIIVNVDDDFLKKHDMQSNDAVAATDQNKFLFKELDEMKPKYNAGGCSLNTARCLQRVLQIENVSIVLGAIGSDNYGTILQRRLQDDGVSYIFDEIANRETGKCAVLLTGNNRSLCTDLGASNCFTISHLKSIGCWNAVTEANFFYVPGFFLRVSTESVFVLADYSSKAGKTFTFNLSAPFLCEVYQDEMRRLLPFVDILFGNESEARTFAKVNECDSGKLEEILLFLGKCCKRSGVVVVTRGANTICVVQNGKMVEYTVGEVKNIVDTTSAGDAFVGGFMARYIQGKPIEECVEGGVKIAEEVIQCVGCNFKSKN